MCGCCFWVQEWFGWLTQPFRTPSQRPFLLYLSWSSFPLIALFLFTPLRPPPPLFHLCFLFRFRLLHAHVPLVLLLQQPSQLQPALVPDLASFSKAAVLLRCATRCPCSQNIDLCFFSFLYCCRSTQSCLTRPARSLRDCVVCVTYKAAKHQRGPQLSPI